MYRVLSDCVAGSQAQCLIDLTAIREDSTYSASLSSFHGLPPPGRAARDRHRLPRESLFQCLRRSIAARVLNCRISATSWSKLDTGRRSYANPTTRDSSRRGLATMLARHRARDGDVERLREKRKSRVRGTSSALAEALYLRGHIDVRTPHCVESRHGLPARSNRARRVTLSRRHVW